MRGSLLLRALRIVVLSVAGFAALMWVEQRTYLIRGFGLKARLHDEAGRFSRADRHFADQTLQALQQELGVDVQMIFAPTLGGEPIEAYAVRRARELGVGRETGRRGLLFVYDVASRDLRVEVGPLLQDTFTDAFISRMLRRHAGAIFGAGSPRDAFVTTMLIVAHRLRQEALVRSYDPAFTEYIDDLQRLASGGGASVVAADEADSSGFANADPDAAARSFFVPQPTPVEAYRRYLAWLAYDRYLPDVSLFTPASRSYLASLTMTPGFQEYVLLTLFEAQYAVDQREHLAMVYHLDDPFAQPLFLIRSAEGWQFDVTAEVRNTRNQAGAPYAWSLHPSGDAFNTAFADRWLPIGGTWRVKGGDNRTLTIHDAKLRKRYATIYSDDAIANARAVELLPVQNAARCIGAAVGEPSVVLIYHPGGPIEGLLLEDLAKAATGWEDQGVRVLAFAFADDSLASWLPVVLQQKGATWAPAYLRSWPSGALDRAMAPLGVRIGASFSHPLLAVRSRDGVVRWQEQGVTDLEKAEEAVRAVVQQ